MTADGPNFRWRRAAWWLCLACCLQAAACYSYAGRFRVVPGSRATLADRSPVKGYAEADLEAAREITRVVAERFGMEHDDEAARLVNEMNRELGHPYEVLTYYSRHDEGAPTRAERAWINMGVDARADRTELIFWIRDLDHGGETDLTRAIKAELERRIRARFDASHLRYEKEKIATFMSG